MTFSNKNVLITGGAGFIGANFAYKFLDLGYNVHLIEKKESNLWRLKDVKDKIKINFVDLRNYNKLESFIIKLNPQIILHFAAYGAYPGKQKKIKEMIDTNLLGTINLINACSKINFECFINTGSSSEYGIKVKPMKEEDSLEPNNLYGITKVATTMYCQYMAKKLDLPIITMRLFAAYGYFEEKERLIPMTIKSCLMDDTLNLSSPKSVRDFIFVEDIIDAYLLAIKKIKKVKGGVFNIGSGKQNTVDKVVKIIKKIEGVLNVKINYKILNIAKNEIPVQYLDWGKAKNLLKWTPIMTFENGIKKTFNWYKNNL